MTSNLPTQADMLRRTKNILNTVYGLISDGSDVLRSDWRPGSTTPDEFVDARTAYWEWARETKTMINELKNQLDDGIAASKKR